MNPTYSDIVNGINGVIGAAHPGLTVLDHEPSEIEPPTLYTLFDSALPNQKGQIKTVTYRLLHRLCIRWEENDMAERELMPYVTSIPDCIQADPWLNGTLSSGLAAIVEILGTFVSISNTTYRCVDFYSEITVKA